MPVPQDSIPATFPSAASVPVSAPGQYNRPDSYIDRRLRIGEQILYRTRLHRVLLFYAFLNLIAGGALFLFYKELAALPATLAEPSAPPGQTIMELSPLDVWFFYFIAFLFGLAALQILIRFSTSELAITDKRVLGRYGTLWSKTVDIALADISLVKSRRFSIPDQGTITLAYIPRRYAIFQYIPHPKEFRLRLDSILPVVRPRIARINAWKVFSVVLIVLGVIAAGIFTLFYFTGGRELMMPVEPVTFGTISQYPDQRRVTIEGTLHLPTRVRCDEYCGVILVDYTNPELSIPVFINVPDYGETLEPNQMDTLPTIFDYEDFRVRLNDGVIVGDEAAVRLTGHICHTIESNVQCISGITLIEAGNPP